MANKIIDNGSGLKLTPEIKSITTENMSDLAIFKLLSKNGSKDDIEDVMKGYYKSKDQILSKADLEVTEVIETANALLTSILNGASSDIQEICNSLQK